MSQVADAISYLKRSITLAKSRELRTYVIIPLIFNILVFGGLYWLSGSWIAGWITAATADWALTGFWSFLNGALHFLVDAPHAAGFRALEKHMLEDMREAGSKPFALVNTAGLRPSLHGNNRRTVILANDNGQSIIEHDQPRVTSRIEQTGGVG